MLHLIQVFLHDDTQNQALMAEEETKVLWYGGQSITLAVSQCFCELRFINDIA